MAICVINSSDGDGDVTAAELESPSLTTQEMVRLAVLGLSEVLL